MVQKIHPWGVIWVPSNRPQAGHLSEKNDDLAVQYEDVHALRIIRTYQEVKTSFYSPSVYVTIKI